VAAVLLPATAVAQLTGSGTLVSSFITPVPSCITTTDAAGARVPTCDGVGTNDISWGDPGTFGIGQSSFSFTPNTFTNVLQGRPFVLGTLTFFNGTIFVGTEITDVMLQIQTTSATPEFNRTLGLPLRIVQTVNQNVDPLADADFLFFSDALQFGSFRVFEGASATVEILGQFNSLNNLGFGRITGGSGFLSSSVSAVPEPATAGLCAIGLVGLLGASRLRTFRRKP